MGFTELDQSNPLCQPHLIQYPADYAAARQCGISSVAIVNLETEGITAVVADCELGNGVNYWCCNEL